MQITLINCNTCLSAFGLNMENAGAFDSLLPLIGQHLSYTRVEYNFPPDEKLIIEVEDGTEIPDLSMFGEVVTSDDFNR